jgi:hypothetical protein
VDSRLPIAQHSYDLTEMTRMKVDTGTQGAGQESQPNAARIQAVGLNSVRCVAVLVLSLAVQAAWAGVEQRERCPAADVSQTTTHVGLSEIAVFRASK